MGVSAPLLLGELRQLALAAGLDVISCPCPLFPFGRIEHLFLPELDLGFMMFNRFHSVTLTPERTIHARRFTDLEMIRSRKRESPSSSGLPGIWWNSPVLCWLRRKRSMTVWKNIMLTPWTGQHSKA